MIQFSNFGGHNAIKDPAVGEERYILSERNIWAVDVKEGIDMEMQHTDELTLELINGLKNRSPIEGWESSSVLLDDFFTATLL